MCLIVPRRSDVFMKMYIKMGEWKSTLWKYWIWFTKYSSNYSVIFYRKHVCSTLIYLSFSFSLSPVCLYLRSYYCTYLCIRVRAHATFCSGSVIRREVFLTEQGSQSATLFVIPVLDFFNCLSPFLLSFSPSFTFSLFVLLHILETVFLQLSLSLHPSPSHLCPVLRLWSRLPISMVTGWCSKRAVAALLSWMLTGSLCDLAATSSACGKTTS